MWEVGAYVGRAGEPTNFPVFVREKSPTFQKVFLCCAFQLCHALFRNVTRLVKYVLRFVAAVWCDDHQQVSILHLTSASNTEHRKFAELLKRTNLVNICGFALEEGKREGWGGEGGEDWGSGGGEGGRRIPDGPHGILNRLRVQQELCNSRYSTAQVVESMAKHEEHVLQSINRD